jgi:hypothetical protein
MKNKFPSKTTTNVLEDEIEYCQKLIDVIENEGHISEYPKVKETLADDIAQLQISEDEDAKVWVIKQRILLFLVTKHIWP